MFLAAALFLAAGSAQADPTASPSAGTELEWALGQLNPIAQAGDPAQNCAACFSDCTRRYGRACHLLCAPYSLCSSLCGDRQRECNNECSTQLSCRRRIRSCQADLPIPPAPGARAARSL